MRILSTELQKLKENDTRITIEIEENEKGINIILPNKNVPKLFCDFPLVWTEKFYFPVIVNNPFFEIT